MSFRALYPVGAWVALALSACSQGGGDPATPASAALAAPEPAAEQAFVATGPLHHHSHSPTLKSRIRHRRAMPR
jgi:uncharacterized lipoprotein YbaY